MDTYLSALTELRADIQKTRIQFGNRVAAVERGATDGTYQHYLEQWHRRLIIFEDEIDEALADVARDEPIIALMVQVKGVGLILAAQVVAEIDIRRAETVSALWRYAGYGVVDGAAERLKKGEPAHFNRHLKTICYKVAASMLRTNSPYRRIYDAARVYYEQAHPDWTKAHQHAAALRKMIKLWLAHLWEVWRKLEGLPVREPYIVASDAKHHYIAPQEFGWPDVEAVGNE